MGWEKEYEHLRDKGRTWGPGIDDVEELTNEQIAKQDALREAYNAKLKAYSVTPRQECVEAGKRLKEIAENRDYSRDEYSKKKIEFCQEACKSLGYSLALDGFYDYLQNYEKDKTFAVSVEYHGWVSGRGGNVHDCFVFGIKDVEQCLQLVADFGAIGAIPTTWYGRDFHFTTRNTGELRDEFIRRLDIGQIENVENGQSLDDKITNAIERSDENNNKKDFCVIEYDKE